LKIRGHNSTLHAAYSRVISINVFPIQILCAIQINYNIQPNIRWIYYFTRQSFSVWRHFNYFSLPRYGLRKVPNTRRTYTKM